jgi:hypothetical protein
MKRKMRAESLVVVCVRLVLTAVLVWQVYGETGPWTAFTVSLFAVCIELQNLVNRRKS